MAAAHVRLIAVTTTPRAFVGNVERTKNTVGIVVGLGIHPQLVGTEHADLRLFSRLLPQASVIGEVGLDASPQYYKTISQQEHVFSRIIEMATSAGGRPMTVHGVRAFHRVLNLIETHDTISANRYALHWFSGSESEARAALQYGCYFSVNEAMLASTRGLTVVKSLPREVVLTETDGPFIKRGSEVLRPSMVANMVEHLAAMWNLSTLATRELIEANFDRFILGSR